MDHVANMPSDHTIPRPALLLGWLGVLPFAASCLGVVAGSARTAELASQVLVVYATVIVSFMGGVQWGLAMIAPDGGSATLPRRLAISTLPALAAFVMAALPVQSAMLGLAAVFCALLAYDAVTVRAGVAPRWYLALRVQLTAAVVLCLILAAAFGGA